MEMLAQEKAALAQSLANEKDALMSNNQDLTDQLKKCFSQLQETTALLEKEQQLNLQLEKNHVVMEEEKFNLQQLVADKEQENAKLETTILKLEAALEKEKAANLDTQKMLQDKLELVESLQGDLQYAIKNRDVLEQEKDELQHQIAVLLEERDAARSHEEELFEKLTDVTNDLEKLQESYVDIADRCNDAQDEVSELRDQIQNLQEALALQRAAFAKTVHTQPTNCSTAENSSSNSLYRSEPKPPPENGGSSHKRSAKSVTVQKQASGRSMEFNRSVDNESGKELLISVDDSKHVARGNIHDGISHISKPAVEEDYYQEDFDEFQE
jgi:chromosome segregation ATPase